MHLHLPKWILEPPAQSPIGDHDVAQRSSDLQGLNLAFLITGSVAAMKAPLIIRDLRREGASVTAFASQSGLKYVTRDSLAWSTYPSPVITVLTPNSEHLSGSQPYDAYLVVPASYNTINKTAKGVADSVITTTLSSALGYLAQGQTKILVAPAMHGSMHNPILIESLTALFRMGVQLIKPRRDFGKNSLSSREELLQQLKSALLN